MSGSTTENRRLLDRAARQTFTRSRIERIVVVAIGFGCAVLGVQALLNALSTDQVRAEWNLALLLAAFVPFALMIVAAIFGVLPRLAFGVFASVFPLVLIAWPWVALDPRPGVEPWVWYLVNVATAAAVPAFPILLQVVWAVLVPLLYGVARALQVGADALAPIPLLRDIVFAMILAGVVVILAQMLRTAARRIDEARIEANTVNARAAAAEAAETERVDVAALMHDSVLAALIAAERAESPRENQLAATMAREALTRLANAERDAGEGSDEPVTPGQIADAIDLAATELGFDLVAARDIASDAPSVPGRVARAITLAAGQAVTNAVEHAGGSGISAEVVARGRTVLVRIIDTGGGFDLSGVAEDRLGIRGSIFARIAAAAGHARIDSTDAGTTVTLVWEHPE